ncbi:hypothetical protein FEA48_21115 [Pseudomonas nitroreducens]|uniref:Trypsin-co-occurring domain-containing protein n=1 Tax=Pseudomonas nitroreducens TaxID=46680 RepID=A0A5R9A0B6_PSENT|nr:trypco2 family protein [Pseudomonas nitroreducens]TLP71327.1 hypothetical protein FEA48_21115 [Pseudomonas nitroreducens]
MKGGISLQEFIAEVKSDLIQAIDNENPFFAMTSVELEVSFTLDVSGGAKAKFLVVDAGMKSSASQVHKVKLTLTPFVPIEAGESRTGDAEDGSSQQKGKGVAKRKSRSRAGGGAGGGITIRGKGLVSAPVYAPVPDDDIPY